MEQELLIESKTDKTKVCCRSFVELGRIENSNDGLLELCEANQYEFDEDGNCL